MAHTISMVSPNANDLNRCGMNDNEEYIPESEPDVWWQDEADVWEGKLGERRKWIGRFSLKEVRKAIQDGRLKQR